MSLPTETRRRQRPSRAPITLRRRFVRSPPSRPAGLKPAFPSTEEVKYLAKAAPRQRLDGGCQADPWLPSRPDPDRTQHKRDAR